MKTIDYRVSKIAVGSKIRPITIYHPDDMLEQKHLYEIHRGTLTRATHKSVYSYLCGRSSQGAVASISAHAYVADIDFSVSHDTLPKRKVTVILAKKDEE